MLTALAAVVILLVVVRLRYSGTAPMRLAAQNCNGDLWKHVGSPERLRLIEACTAVEGKVVSVYRASDGDLHISLDPDHTSALNFMNALHAGGYLVVEVICEHTPADDDAKSACAGFVSKVTIPKTGDRIRVIGAYVTDRENGWNEVHPVTRIETLN